MLSGYSSPAAGKRLPFLLQLYSQGSHVVKQSAAGFFSHQPGSPRTFTFAHPGSDETVARTGAIEPSPASAMSHAMVQELSGFTCTVLIMEPSVTWQERRGRMRARSARTAELGSS